MTNTTIATQNVLAVSAEDFEIKKLEELVAQLRKTHKAAVSIDKDIADVRQKLDENRAKVQEAIEEDNYGDMQTYSSKCKQLAKKLEETNPDVVRADFNKAIDAMQEYFTPAVVESTQLRAVGE